MSQNARILEVLGDGKHHSMREIHARAGFMRLNSRVSELRCQGYEIECWREGRDYIYRLNGRTLDSASAAKADGESVSPRSPSPSGLALAESSVSAPNPAAVQTPQVSTAPASRDGADTLQLFECEIDESAGLRGAYSEPDAA